MLYNLPQYMVSPCFFGVFRVPANLGSALSSSWGVCKV